MLMTTIEVQKKITRPGLGLTFPGLGRARAYSENHSCFNIMFKDDPHLTIAIRSLFAML